jgi:hypothetical protein
MLLKSGHYYRDAMGTIWCIVNSYTNSDRFTDLNKLYSWNKDGKNYHSSKYDLVSEVVVTDVVPPSPQVVYLNIYEGSMSYYKTKESADTGHAWRPEGVGKRISRVRVEYVEDQFDN